MPLRFTLLKKYWKSICVIAFFLPALILWSLPLVLTYAIVNIYEDQNPELNLSISNIDLNIFTGTFALYKAKAQDNHETVLQLDQLQLNIGMLALLKKTLLIESFYLSDLETHTVYSNDTLKLAGLTIPLKQSKTDAAPNTDSSSFIENIIVQNLQIKNIRLDASTEKLKTRLQLASLDIDHWQLHDSNKPSHIYALLNNNSTQIYYLTEPLELLAGTNIELNADLSGDLSKPIVKADIKLKDLKITAPNIKTDILAFDTLYLKNSQYSHEQISLDNFVIENISILKTDKTTGLLAEQVLLTKLGLSPDNNITLQTTELKGINAYLERDKDGKLQPLDRTLSKLFPTNPKQETRQSGNSSSNKKMPVIEIETIALTGKNHITFIDQAVEQTFKSRLELKQLNIANINSANTDSLSQIRFSGALDDYNSIDIIGSLNLFADKISGDIKADIKQLELPPASPYIKQATGYFIKTGQLNANTDLKLDHGILTGITNIHLQAIKLEPADQKKMQQVEKTLSMPLDYAIGILRDEHGDVRLEVPIKGDMNDPKFHLGDITKQVTAKALKYATVHYLKNMIQPFGTFISVASFAVKKAGAITLDPIEYQAGISDIPQSSLPYLDKLAELMNKKTDLRLKLCSHSTGLDKKQLPDADETQLTELARQRAMILKNHLIDKKQIPAERILLCQPMFLADTEQNPFILPGI